MQLHVLLHAFAADAAATLCATVAAGEEVPFEIVEEGAHGSRPGLYHYEPLVGQFLDRHWDGLARLPSAHSAATALGTLAGLREYLDTYAKERRASAPLAQEALRCFTHRLFDGQGGEFDLLPERFEPAYRELHQLTMADESELVVVALVRGIACESAEVALAERTVLVPLERLEVLPPGIGRARHAARSPRIHANGASATPGA